VVAGGSGMYFLGPGFEPGEQVLVIGTASV
jgi:hypothetical protein